MAMTKYILRYIIVSSIVVTVLFLIFNWTMESIIHAKKEIMVPQLEGKTLKEAINILSALNLALTKEGEEYNSALPQDTIIRQNPQPGITVREGKIIKVTLCKGSELVFVPEVIGQTLKIAKLTIRKNQLQVDAKNQIYSLRFSKDEIVSQSPEPNSIVDKNSSVALTVSLGSPPEDITLMPDFIGKSINEFKVWSKQNKINYELIIDKYESQESDIVLKQEPSPDTIIDYDTSIVMVISKGSDLPTEQINQKVYVTPPELFYYEIPQGTKEQEIKIVLIDETGEKEIFHKVQLPGTKIELPILKKGKAKLRIFTNNILVEERELQ